MVTYPLHPHIVFFTFSHFQRRCFVPTMPKLLLLFRLPSHTTKISHPLMITVVQLIWSSTVKKSNVLELRRNYPTSPFTEFETSGIGLNARNITRILATTTVTVGLEEAEKGHGGFATIYETGARS